MAGLKRMYLSFLFLLVSVAALAQVRFSFATDLSVLRNFSPNQKFWALGSTVQGNFHLSGKDGVYAWVSYYTPGRFNTNYSAQARQPATVPQSVSYRVRSRWAYNNISVGWKHYFKGSFAEENTWGLYGLAGFGLQFNKVENVYSTFFDTSAYALQSPAPGVGNFKRLTLDLGIGVEYPVGGDFFIYSDLRTWLPASDYPSPWLHDPKRVPLPLTLGAGLRILF
jgi:hypothetical protein